jgi:murein DD-endopeptidase MepM/ murein hydrolase activator NlpD
MIPYGCTPAPYYDPDPACPGRQGFHHGIDVAMPCGTPLLSAVDGVVLDPSSSGAPGAAYGERPFRIRMGSVDVLIGHARRVLVEPGERVHAGQRIALASDSGAPDGCHLHFEVRRQGGGVSDALDPAERLQLR